MAEENLKLEYGPSSETYFGPPPVPCRECDGSGKVALLVTVVTMFKLTEIRGPERGSEVVRRHVLPVGREPGMV